MLARDSRGLKSWTLTLALPAWAVLVLKFAVSGITVGTFAVAPMDPAAFAVAFTSIIAPILARKWLQKGNENGNPNPPAA